VVVDVRGLRLVIDLDPAFRLGSSSLYFNGSDDILERIILDLGSLSNVDEHVGVVCVGIPPSPMARNILIFLAIAGFSWQGPLPPFPFPLALVVPAPAPAPAAPGPLENIPKLFNSLLRTSSLVLVAILLE